MAYCLGNGLELFSALTVFALCQDCKVFANHAWQNNHSIDFDNVCVIDKGNYRVRKTLESWHTAKTEIQKLPKKWETGLEKEWRMLILATLSSVWEISKKPSSTMKVI